MRLKHSSIAIPGETKNLITSIVLPVAVFHALATMLFCFSIFIAMLQSTDSGKELKPSEMLKSAFKSPVFIAVILGIVCGLSGTIKSLLNDEPFTQTLSTLG